jgi:hypothetical protein
MDSTISLCGLGWCVGDNKNIFHLMLIAMVTFSKLNVKDLGEYFISW